MPEHVHLLLTEPETAPLATALQALKQSVSRTLSFRAPQPFWQARYYDFNVWSDKKRIEKLRYIHRNPVTRGLVQQPEDWSCPASCTMRLASRELSKSSQNGRRANARHWEHRPQCVPVLPSNSRPSQARTGHPDSPIDEHGSEH